MLKYQLYVGANNVTKKVDYEKLTSITSAVFEGFTIAKTIGYWQGSKEESCIVTIFGVASDRTIVDMLAHELCAKLDQSAILVGYPDGTGELIS